jgi:ketosteroid isomerase-like protein
MDEMITELFAKKFAQEWVDSWNSHDLARILSHYTADFVFESPMALKLVPQSGGVLNGKEAIAAYWTIGLERIPDLHFELLDLLIGVNGLTIYYFNKANGKKTAEVFFFNQAGKVEKSFAYYS